MNKTWKVVLAFTAVFLAGSIFGGLLAMRVGPRMAQKRSGPPPVVGRELLGHFADRLGLTAAQKEKIRPMVERADDEVRKLQQGRFKETGAVLRRLQQEISGELTPEQRKKLEKLQERQRELMLSDRPGMQLLRERMGGKREGGSPPPPPLDGPKP
jgi:Spy/CpxP family protein refolding chaperone